MPEPTRRLWKACGSISRFSILFWQRPFGRLDRIVLVGFKYMSSNQLYNSLQINTGSKGEPSKNPQLLRFAQLQGNDPRVQLPDFRPEHRAGRSAKEQQPSKIGSFARVRPPTASTQIGELSKASNASDSLSSTKPGWLCSNRAQRFQRRIASSLPGGRIASASAK